MRLVHYLSEVFKARVVARCTCGVCLVHYLSEVFKARVVCVWFHYLSEVFKARVVCVWFTTLARYSRHVWCASGSLP